MALRDILVHLDNSPRCEARVALAVDLAQAEGASLSGLFAELLPATRVGVVASWPSEDYLAAVAEGRRRFKAATAELGDRARFLEINRGGEAEILSRTTDFARLFDLVVLGQSEESVVRVPSDLPERIIQDSGRPVLVLPYVGHYGKFGQRPLFAWTRGRAAARAMADALPLIAKGADALVVQAGKADEPLDEFADLVVSHLAAHEISAKFQTVVVEDVKLMDTLLNHSADHAADLLVIGAFENAGFPFVGRGSGTRYVLRHMTLPVLFSH